MVDCQFGNDIVFNTIPTLRWMQGLTEAASFICLSHHRGIKCSLTFELDLQHFVGILNDVTIRPESVAGAMDADLQAKIGL